MSIADTSDFTSWTERKANPWPEPKHEPLRYFAGEGPDGAGGARDQFDGSSVVDLRQAKVKLQKLADDANPKDRLGQAKVSLALIPPAGEIYEALAFEDGARKYGPYNWREKKVRMMVYLNAIKRHVACLLDGEWLTDDTMVPHLGSIGACASILADAFETGNLIDDRPKPGNASALIARTKKAQ